VSYRGREVWVYIIFEKQVEIKESRTVMGIDINFNNITYTVLDFEGKLVTTGIIPFNGLRKALSHKIISEKIQKKYHRKWRYVKSIREVIRRHGRRARNILTDSCHYVSRKLVSIAKEYNALIVLEDLNKLRARVNGSRKFNRKLGLWVHYRVQSYIYYKALLEGLKVVYVNPRGTSKASPTGGKIVFINYRWVKLPNGHVVTRDIVALWNIALKGLNISTRNVGSRGLMDSPKAPDQMQTQEGMKGKLIQVPKITKIPKR